MRRACLFFPVLHHVPSATHPLSDASSSPGPLRRPAARTRIRLSLIVIHVPRTGPKLPGHPGLGKCVVERNEVLDGELSVDDLRWTVAAKDVTHRVEPSCIERSTSWVELLALALDWAKSASMDDDAPWKREARHVPSSRTTSIVTRTTAGGTGSCAVGLLKVAVNQRTFDTFSSVSFSAR